MTKIQVHIYLYYLSHILLNLKKGMFYSYSKGNAMFGRLVFFYVFKMEMNIYCAKLMDLCRCSVGWNKYNLFWADSSLSSMFSKCAELLFYSEHSVLRRSTTVTRSKTLSGVLPWNAAVRPDWDQGFYPGLPGTLLHVWLFSLCAATSL